MTTFMYTSNDTGKLLAKALNIRTLKHRGTKFEGGEEHSVINWGSTKPLPFKTNGCVLLNKPEATALVLDKFKWLTKAKDRGINVPCFTNRILEAQEWLEDGALLVCDGELVEHVRKLKNGLVYTKYSTKKEEYRVHVIKGRVCLDENKHNINQKDGIKFEWRIRSEHNGFYWGRGAGLPNTVRDQAIAAIGALDLDFGAVTVLWKKKADKATVIKVETSPVLTRHTLLAYAYVFKKHLGIIKGEDIDVYDLEEMAQEMGIRIDK